MWKVLHAGKTSVLLAAFYTTKWEWKNLQEMQLCQNCSCLGLLYREEFAPWASFPLE